MFLRKRVPQLFFALSLWALAVSAQEFRGSISGRITDAGDAAVVNATVTVTNTATNASVNTTTNQDGDYSVLYLTPGTYNIVVEGSGFKRVTRQGIEVRVGDKLELNVKMEVGAVSETVNITSDTPLLDTNTASAGQVIDQRRISELPLSDGNPFVLSRLVPGVAFTGDLKFSRPFDNGGTSSIVADGAPGRNEFTLDGVPNMASGGGVGRVAFVPPADAVQEFKVETASYDGQQSHTAGATVNVTLKSGTNAFHGTAYEFVRNDVLSANDFFINRTNLATNPSRDKDKDGKADRDPLRYNRYGGVIGGPVFLPRFGTGGRPYWLGRNRSFFFFAYEGLKDVFPEPGLFTVPTLAERNGDFSALLALGSQYQIYDPATARLVTGNRVQRDPFPGNIIPANRISPIARAYLSYYPLPNQQGDPQGRSNFLPGNARTDTFHSESFRFDQTVSEKQRFFVRYTHNNRREARGNWTGEVNGIRPIGNYLFRINNGGSFDHVYNLSATTVLNTRVGFSRFNEPNVRQHEGQISPASLGFSPATAALFGDASYLPRFEIGNYDVIGQNPGDATTFNIYSFQPTLTRIAGKHSLRFGYDFRSYRENNFNPGNVAGKYVFRTDYTRGPLDTSSAAPIGQDLASFLLGLFTTNPNDVSNTATLIDRNAARSNQSLYHGIFAHDDWKLSSKLTLNLGVRYEYEGATTERYNRNVRTFDPNPSNPIEAAAKAAYAANPIPEIPAASFNVKGGLTFVNDQQRGFWNPDKNNLQPRAGFAYQINDKTVVRGGWGVYTVPFIVTGTNQPGFSQATISQPSPDNGLTFRASLFNPFPDGVVTPPGASLGLATFVGQSISALPNDVRNTQAMRWSLGVQRELPGNWLLELSYVGNHGYDGVVTSNVNLDPIPRQYLSTSPVRDQTVINFLSATFPNPFRGLVPGSSLNTATTIARSQLLRPFPQFTGIGWIRNDANSDYQSAQVRAEKRFSKGYTTLVSYTWSKFLEAASLLNETDTNFERRLSDSDIPHRLVVSGIWEIPLGRGRTWGRDWNRALDAVVGGWQVQGIWNWQSGRPSPTLGNVYYNGDVTRLRTNVSSASVDNVAFDISGFYFHDAAVQTNGADDPNKQRADTRIQLANNIRTLPSRFNGLRGQKLNLWDLSVSKNFSLTEKLRLQLRGEFLNAFNHPIFNDPDLNPRNTTFGKVTSQNNLPRNVQIGLKLIF